MAEEEKKITYLTNDDKIRNQEWVCLSFITPELVENCKVRGVKVRGVYATEEEAKNRCKELQQIDPDFNIYIAPVGCWLPWSDDPEKADDCEYANEELNKLMKAYKENQVKAKMLHENRKNDMIEKNMKEAEERKKKDDTEQNDDIEQNDNNEKNINSVELDSNFTLNEINKVEEHIVKKNTNLEKNIELKNDELNEKTEQQNHIEEELKRAREVYEKIKNEEI